MIAAVMIASVLAGDGKAIGQNSIKPEFEAQNLYPRDGDIDVSHSPMLRWSNGDIAAFHDVYFADDANAVAEASPSTIGVYRGRQARDAITFTPGPLEWNTTYWWRIDEVNDAHPESPWKGNVRRFTTADFLVVDDFENYRYEQGEHIWETWVDGLGDAPDMPGNSTGSLVGEYLMDQVPVVHGGMESMRFEYNNVSVPYYSEVSRIWSEPQDWTIRGLTHLILWIKGSPVPLLVKPDGNVVLGALGGHAISGWRFGYKRATGDCEIGVKIGDFQNNENVTAAGVRIQETQDWNSRYVDVSITADHNLFFSRRITPKGNTTWDRQDGFPSPCWIRLGRTADVFTVEHSADGVIWEQVVSAQRQPIAVSIAMAQTVCIGLEMAGRSSQGNARMEFSDIDLTGDVSEDWQVTSPEWGNAPESLYVALEDAGGRMVGPVHLTMVNAFDWTQWTIPLSDFAGVDLTAVQKMYIGIGNRDDPQPDGRGVIWIDDIRVIQADAAPQQADDTTGTED